MVTVPSKLGEAEASTLSRDREQDTKGWLVVGVEAMDPPSQGPWSNLLLM